MPSLADAGWVDEESQQIEEAVCINICQFNINTFSALAKVEAEVRDIGSAVEAATRCSVLTADAHVSSTNMVTGCAGVMCAWRRGACTHS